MNKEILHRFILVMACAFCVSEMAAVTLSPKEAIARVQMGRNKAKSKILRPESLVLSETFSSFDGKPAIYVFNSSDKAYFIGADSAALPLLGYTDRPLNGEMPPEFKAMMTRYAEIITQTTVAQDDVEGNADYSPNIQPDAIEQLPSITPLLTSQWGQREPYNKFLPEVDGEKCVAGCTPVAFSQMMRYYKQPLSGKGSFTYEPSGTDCENPYHGTLSIDFSTFTFDWENMLDSYEGDYSDSQADAAARLIQSVGYVAQTGYGTLASGAGFDTAAEALSKYFGYNPNFNYLAQRWYERGQWQQLIYDHLKEVGPVPAMSGYRMAPHAYVIDGFHEGMFHINWGWNGYADGYFHIMGPLQNIDMSEDWSICPSIIANLVPEGWNTIEIPSREQMHIGGLLDGTISGSTMNLICNINIRPSEMGDVYKIFAVAENVETGEETISSSYFTMHTQNDEYHYIHDVELQLPSDMHDGNYRIYLHGAKKGQEAKRLYACDFAGYHVQNYINLQIVDGVYTLIAEKKAELTCQTIEFGDPIYFKSKFNLHLEFVNNTDAEISDDLQIDIHDTATGEMLIWGYLQGMNLRPGEKRCIDQIMGEEWRTDVFNPDAHYSLAILSSRESKDNNKIIREIEVDILPQLTQQGVIEDVTFQLEGDTDNIDPNDILLKVSVTVKDNPHQQYWDIEINKKVENPSGSDEDAGTFISHERFWKIHAVGVNEYVLHSSITDPEPDATYFITFQSFSEGMFSWDQRIPFRIKDAGGIEIIKDANASTVVKTELYTIDGRRLNETAHHNGIIIVKEIMQDGSIRTYKRACCE